MTMKAWSEGKKTMKQYEKRFLTIAILVLLFCVTMTFVTISTAKGEDMAKCRRECLDSIDVNSCVDEEREYWGKEYTKKKDLIKACKDFIRNEYDSCFEECQKDKENG